MAAPSTLVARCRTTAAIGILVGVGFWFAAILGALAALTILSLFRAIESRLCIGCLAFSTAFVGNV